MTPSSSLIPAQRRPTFVFALVLALLLSGLGGPVQPETAVAQDAALGYAPGELLIGWAPDGAPGGGAIPTVPRAEGWDENRADPNWQRSVQAVALRTGLDVLDAHPAYQTARLAVPVGQEQAEIQRLESLPWITYAEPNYIAHAASMGLHTAATSATKPLVGAQLDATDTDDYYPNDPFIGDQWYMRRVGAPSAWAVTKGSYSIVVAVVDSGIDSTHPEFANRLLSGWDYVNRDPYPDDLNGHGTHVAGILAAAADNSLGIAGLTPNIKILPLQVLDSSGFGLYDDIASAVERAADSAVAVVNLSLGGAYYSTRLKQAVDYATAKGTLVVAAAGNCAQGGPACNFQTNPDYYPAGFDGVLAVAASTRYDGWANYSGNRSYVALAAPGGTSSDQIWSTVPGGYAPDYGTSMAAPLVSGAAALIWTLSPAASSASVANILKNTADKIGVYAYVGGRNNYFGYGRLNVAKAVRKAYPPSLTPIAGAQQFLLDASGLLTTRRLTIKNPSDQAISWRATVTQGSQWLQASPATGAASYSDPGSITLTVDAFALPPGPYTGIVRIDAINPAVGSYNISVQLQVLAQLKHAYLPLSMTNRLQSNWIDPTGGTALNLGNDTSRQLLLPFPVGFFGETYNEIWISDNGLATFGLPHSSPPGNQQSCLPSATAPNNAIFALWSDLNPQLGGQIFAEKLDSQRYVITWSQVPRADGTDPQSFQLVLSRGGGFLLQYLHVDQPLQGTIGLKNMDGTLAQISVCNGAGRSVIDGDALNLVPSTPW